MHACPKTIRRHLTKASAKTHPKNNRRVLAHLAVRPIQPLTTCPEPHVKRAFPEGLPASPLFTWVPGLLPVNARLTRDSEASRLERSKDGEYRPTDHSAPLRPAGSRRSIQPLTACPEPRVKRAFPEGLPASPVFTGVPGRPAGKCPIDKGYRSGSAALCTVIISSTEPLPPSLRTTLSAIHGAPPAGLTLPFFQTTGRRPQPPAGFPIMLRFFSDWRAAGRSHPANPEPAPPVRAMHQNRVPAPAADAHGEFRCR